MNTEQKIQNAVEQAQQFKSFTELYSDSELWGMAEGPVNAVTLIEWIIDNPDLVEIAKRMGQLLEAKQ